MIILPGTTITLRGAAPASSSTIFSSASAAASIASGFASAGTVMRLRTLPLTWIGYSTLSSTSHFSSATGNGPCASDSVCPSRDLTTTPRQRIVLRREMARQPPGSPVLEVLLKEYEYDALETCATDSTCALACPLEIAVSDKATAQLLLQAMGYRPYFSFDKRRESWRLGNWRIELDEVPLLGRFVEVETAGSREVELALAALGLDGLEPITRGYASLLHRHLRERGITSRRVRFRELAEAT